MVGAANLDVFAIGDCVGKKHLVVVFPRSLEPGDVGVCVVRRAAVWRQDFLWIEAAPLHQVRHHAPASSVTRPLHPALQDANRVLHPNLALTLADVTRRTREWLLSNDAADVVCGDAHAVLHFSIAASGLPL